jgi:hypothetical protein
MLNNLTTSEIYKKLKNFKPFIGVFACNEIPQIPIGLRTYGFVVNTDPRELPGEHWVACFVSNGKGEYFDSFGLPPINNEIIDFFNKNTISCSYNRTIIQSATSAKCGAFCILFLYCKFNNIPTWKFYWLFSNNLEVNDLLLEWTI